MSLSVTALLETAVQDVPQAVIEIDGGSALTVEELDWRSRVAAGGWLAAELSFGAEVAVASTPGLDRAVGVLAAWRAGFVVSLRNAGHSSGPSAVDATTETENLLGVAESQVWSETAAVITSAGVTLTHADLLAPLRHVAGRKSSSVRSSISTTVQLFGTRAACIDRRRRE